MSKLQWICHSSAEGPPLKQSVVICVYMNKNNLLYRLKSEHFALRPQKRGGLLGTGAGWEEGGGGGTGHRPGRPRRSWTAARTTNTFKVVSHGHCVATSVLHNCCLNCCAEQSHKDTVRSTARKRVVLIAVTPCRIP